MKHHNSPELALIALGSNIPRHPFSVPETMLASINLIPLDGESVSGVSRLFGTPCFPAGSGPDYVNAAVALKTHRTARELLDHLHAIEAEFGRERRERWGRRTLDLDLLAIGDQILPDNATYQTWADLPLETQKMRAPEDLILPHPRMHERAFVLIPLADVAGNWIHPILGQSVDQLVEALPQNDKMDIKPL